MLKKFLGLSSAPCWPRSAFYMCERLHVSHVLPATSTRHFSMSSKSSKHTVTYGVVSERPTVSAASPPVKDSLRVKFNFIADVVEKVSPAVVFIQRREMDCRRIFGFCIKYFRQSYGSGFIISSDGLIVTNAHVVQSAKHDRVEVVEVELPNGSAKHDRVEVELPNGRKYIGEIQVLDPASDLALLKINDTNLPTIKLASSESLRSGEWVVAVGSPLSLTNTVTSGIVSSIDRKGSDLGLRNSINYIQTDAYITHGNSGGPLINLDGEAVGVNTGGRTEGFRFAIRSDYVKTFIKSQRLEKKSKCLKGGSAPVHPMGLSGIMFGSGRWLFMLNLLTLATGLMMQKSRPPYYIGIAAITLTPHLTAQLRNRVDIKGLDVDRGVFVVDVNSDSPAQQAGVTKYDIIMKVDDKPVDDFSDLINAVKDKNIVKFTLYRDGLIREVHVRPHRQDSS